MKINITGDFFIHANINEPISLIKNIIPFFENADFNIVNLESPVTYSGFADRVLKTGPHLNGHPESFNVLKKINATHVTLANNHIMDFGSRGLQDTLLALHNNKIGFVGAGENLKEAEKTITLEKDGLKIAIINLAENEWSSAKDNKPGANPLDIIRNLQQIKEARGNHDKVIVIIHGGHEYYHLPSPRMVKQYRFFAENGADAIIGHHTHCISGYEIYNNVPIFYSLGNFLFTLNSKQNAWFTGLLLSLELSKSKGIIFELHPIKQTKYGFSVNLLNKTEKVDVFEEIKKYNNIINDTTLINQHWDNLLHKSSNEYLQYFSPLNAIQNRYIRAGLKILSINKLLMNTNYFALILNLMRCEAHNDISKNILEKHLMELPQGNVHSKS